MGELAIQGLRPEQLTWDQAERMFLLRCRAANLSKQTLDQYGWVFLSFKRFLGEHGGPKPAHITASTIRAYLEACKSKGLSSETVVTYFNRVKTFYLWLHREGLILLNPVEKIEKPRVERRLVKPFSIDEIKALLGVIPRSPIGIRDTALYLLLLDSGLRVSEALGISIGDVDLSNNSVVVMGKGRKQRRTVFGETARRAIMAWLRVRTAPKETDPLFCNRYGERLTRHGVACTLKLYTKKAGIAANRLSAHALRHAFAVNFLKGGGEIVTLQRCLGHTTLEMSKRYLNLTDDEVMQRARSVGVVDRMGALPGVKSRIVVR